jgi:MFS family permease
MLAGIFLRFFQGLGDSLVSTAAYSIITIEFPTKKQSYIGYCQASVGIGLMIGPVIGQALYSFV